jgi:hypothetical protein
MAYNPALIIISNFIYRDLSGRIIYILIIFSGNNLRRKSSTNYPDYINFATYAICPIAHRLTQYVWHLV